MKKIMIPIMFVLALFYPALALTPNETTNFIMTLTDVYGNPINATCYGYVYYPNMTLYQSFQLNYTNGIYYHEWTAPSEYGSYLEVGECHYTLYGHPRTTRAYKTVYVSKSLDVLEERLRQISENATMNVSVNITGQIENVTNQTLDGINRLTALMFAFHSTPVTSKYCADENHLVIVKTATWKAGDWVIPIVKNETEYCEYGCDNSTLRCRPAPYVRNSIIFGVLLIVGLLIYFVKRMI